MHCTDCSRPMVPGRYKGEIPEGHVRHAARGLCRVDYDRAKRSGALAKHQTTVCTTPAEHRIEDIEWLIRDDHNAESIARRSGFANATSAVRFLQRHNRHDLANELARYVMNGDVYADNYGAAAFGIAV